MTAFKRSQAKYVKGKYKTTNWSGYEAGLRQRGSLTVWISEDELKGWGPPQRRRRKPGGQERYSNHAIETALTVGMVFHLRLRQTEGFLRSLFLLLVLDGRVPDHTTISRRAKKLGKLPICAPAGNKPVHILVDSTGLSIHVGNLRKPPKRRDWRKLHIAVDALTGEVVASDLTSKSATDASRVPALVEQIERPLGSVSATLDSALTGLNHTRRTPSTSQKTPHRSTLRASSSWPPVLTTGAKPPRAASRKFSEGAFLSPLRKLDSFS